MTTALLDSMVFEAIRSGKTRAGAIRDHIEIGASMNDVNLSLQRLRRRGRIEYGSANRETAFFGWRVAK